MIQRDSLFHPSDGAPPARRRAIPASLLQSWARGFAGAWPGYAIATAGVAAMTGVIRWIGYYAQIANISILYLLVILLVAVVYGRGPAVLASVLAFLAFDWFFVRPVGHLTVHDPAEWVALLMFLLVGLITAQLAALLRAREAEARRRAEETAALERMSWSVASHVEEQAILDEVVRRLTDVAPVAAAAVLRPANGAGWQVAARTTPASALPEFERPLASEEGPASACVRLCYENRTALGWEGSPALWAKGYAEPSARAEEPGSAVPWLGVFLPLIAQGRIVGVLYLLPSAPLGAHERRLIESLANHAAVALARERLSREAARAQALEEADRLKDALLSMVSHDFRSPLASIKASVTGLMQDDAGWDPAVRRELLAGIDQETDRLNRLVKDLLDMSRLEAGAWQTEREPCAVADIIGEALEALAREEDARVVTALPGDLPTIPVDPAQMGRVLGNLLENALKYSDGPVEIAATASTDTLALSVADRGPGLAPGEEAHVFDKFYRGPRFRESSVPGSGLGLSVCRAICEAHGGRLTARNRPGGGAVFTIELPYDAHSGDR